MRVPSNILTGFKAGGAVIAPNDADIGIPPIIQPTVDLPRPLATTVDIGLSGPFSAQDSCLVGGQYSIVNAARITPNLIDIQPGVWQIHIDWQAGWSFITATLFQLNATYQSTGGSLSVNLLSVPSQIFANGIMNGKIGPFNISTSWVLRIAADVPASGVGQTSYLAVTISAQRLG